MAKCTQQVCNLEVSTIMRNKKSWLLFLTSLTSEVNYTGSPEAHWFFSMDYFKLIRLNWTWFHNWFIIIIIRHFISNIKKTKNYCWFGNNNQNSNLWYMLKLGTILCSEQSHIFFNIKITLSCHLIELENLLLNR